MLLQTTFLERHSETLDQEASSLIQQDVLSTINPNLDGMSITSAWTYNGGQGLAGVHGEDGSLHFMHLLLDIRLDVADELNRRLIEVLQRLSSKVWVVYMAGKGTKGVLSLNKEVGEIFGEEAAVDELLVSRQFVLDPRVMAHNPNFQVVTQLTGDIVYGDAPHSVLGAGFFSVAWNLALSTSLKHYIMAEHQLAAAVRAKSTQYMKIRKTINGGVEPVIRSFMFIASILYYLKDTSFKTGGSFMGVVKEGVKHVLLLEDNTEKPKSANLKLDDSYDLPENANDMQCEKCGVSYIRCKYVPLGGKKGMCGACAVMQKRKNNWEVVSLFNGLMLKTLGVEQGT